MRLTPRWRAFALGVLLSASAVRMAPAQEVGASFLLLPASTRAMAMGGVGIATEGPAALFDDVAGLEGRQGVAMLAVQRHLAGTRAATAAVGFGAGQWMGAAGVHLLDYGAIDEIIPDPVSGGEVGVPTGARLAASDIAIAGGISRAIGALRAGLATKLVRQQVAEASGTTLAVDAGIRVPLVAGVVLSAGAQHVGGRLELSGREADLPALWRAGLASPAARISGVDVRLVAELRDGRGSPGALAAGGEVAWRATPGLRLAGRLGVRSVPRGDEGSPLTLGGALLGERVSLSYAYRGYGALGGVHRVGFGYRRRGVKTED